MNGYECCIEFTTLPLIKSWFNKNTHSIDSLYATVSQCCSYHASRKRVCRLRWGGSCVLATSFFGMPNRLFRVFGSIGSRELEHGICAPRRKLNVCGSNSLVAIGNWIFLSWKLELPLKCHYRDTLFHTWRRNDNIKFISPPTRLKKITLIEFIIASFH